LDIVKALNNFLKKLIKALNNMNIDVDLPKLEQSLISLDSLLNKKAKANRGFKTLERKGFKFLDYTKGKMQTAVDLTALC
jgi:hypothetical protein